MKVVIHIDRVVLCGAEGMEGVGQRGFAGELARALAGALARQPELARLETGASVPRMRLPPVQVGRRDTLAGALGAALASGLVGEASR